MKINIAVISPDDGIGGGNRKYAIYFKYLNDDLFSKYYIKITGEKERNKEIKRKNEKQYALTEEELVAFVKEKNIQFVYLGNRLTKNTYFSLKKTAYILRNINFTPLYTTEDKNINLIISKTDYLKLKYMHKHLVNSYVVYNPIDLDLWTSLKKQKTKTFRSFFYDKQTKYIIGRLGRAEPSKWNFLIIKTLRRLQKEKNYKYGFIFAGMPLLYRQTLKFCLNKKMKDKILFLPELKEHKDLAEFYKSIDLFWQTSLIGESFGNVIAEAFCFEVPVITDYKDFFEDAANKKFRVNPRLYNAQSEVVDHNKNGAICIYPDKIIAFLERMNKQNLRNLGKNGLAKVKKQYDAKIAGQTLARILYDILLKDKKIKKDKKFEHINKIPSEREVINFDKEYFKRLEEETAENKLDKQSKRKYLLQEKIWHSTEFVYLIIRKTLRKIGIDIEK